MKTAKQKHKTFRKIFSYLQRSSLDHFHEYIMSVGLYNGKRANFNIEVVVTRIPSTGNSSSVNLNRGHYMSKPPISVHICIEFIEDHKGTYMQKA